MMNKLPLYTLCLVFLVQFCNCSDNKLLIGYENNSAYNDDIVIKTIISNQEVYSDTVRRNTHTSAIKFWRDIELSDVIGDTIYFIMGKGNDEYLSDKITLAENSLKDKWLHVNFTEMLFRKGDDFYGTVLEADTIIERSFYCELVEIVR